MGKVKPEVMRTVKKFKKNAGKKYAVERLILFGSQAAGKARKWSDIDLLVVSRMAKNPYNYMVDLYHEWHINLDINYPVDFLCYTPEEFAEQSKGITIVREALREALRYETH